MAHQFHKAMFTEAVKKLQERYASRNQYERISQSGHYNDALGPREIEFIHQRDSFYLASEGENGWPYIQHRGGPKGFLKVLHPKMLAFGDFSGNKQFITMGNVSHNDKVTLFLMDYPHQTRLKILAHAEVDELQAGSVLAKELTHAGYQAKVERIVKMHVVAFDWNCPRHITPRFTADEILQEVEAHRDPLSGARWPEPKT
jgi:predicted pyridoxine 5'-phosphate oxidase superfamily flavin-nucleotide-binding protein